MAKIRVELQVGRWPSSTYDRVVELPLSDNLVYEALERLDLPDPKAPVYAQMMCTSDFKIQTVMVERERRAKILSEALTKALLEAMGSEDTIMGYKKRR